VVVLVITVAIQLTRQIKRKNNSWPSLRDYSQPLFSAYFSVRALGATK